MQLGFHLIVNSVRSRLTFAPNVGLIKPLNAAHDDNPL